MLRFLLRLVALGAAAGLAYRAVRTMTGQDARRVPPKRTDPGKLDAEEPMVRDRVCNTFLPRSKALDLTVDGQTLFFCSEACRRSFESRAAAGESRPA